MTSEAAFIAALRAIATAPGARGLHDDAAVLAIGGAQLVLTMDAIVEGVHFLPGDPPESVAWKLVASNVSDLAAKGAVPRGCLLAYPLADEDWNAAFLTGLAAACDAFAIPLLGGDTVRPPEGSARSFALVALGEGVAGVTVPSRSAAQPGDDLWLSASVGDAGLGLALLQGEATADPVNTEALVERYRRPSPNPALGVSLAPLVHAMMDVSDGVLIDAARMAQASGARAVIELDRLPLSHAFVATLGNEVGHRLFAAQAGDDYCLLFAAPRSAAELVAIAQNYGATLHRIGRIEPGEGLALTHAGTPVPLPERLGFQH